jgi:uncharacterized membrane protein
MMHRADHEQLRSAALAHDEGAAMIMVGTVCAVAASLSAIAIELSGARSSHTMVAAHLGFAALTLVGSWLLLPTLFALSYASVYYRGGQQHGLEFPGEEPQPDYADFMYFAITVAATSQTSDVMVTSRAMRHWVLAHAVLSFAFNTTLLALAINILAGLL